MLKSKIQNVEYNTPQGPVKVTIHVYGRTGTKAPTSIYIEYKGGLITPYEQDKRGWTPTLTGLFKIIYSPVLERLIPSTDYLLQPFAGSNPWEGSPFIPPGTKIYIDGVE